MFALSPGVYVTEKDLTNIIPAVATSIGGYAGVFAWGPVLDPTTISSEEILAQRFGKPNSYNAASWFTAANFLSYTNNLNLVRAQTSGARNAVDVESGSVTAITIAEGGGGSGYDPAADTVVIGAPDVPGGLQATASFAVDEAGVVTTITIDTSGSGYISNPIIDIQSATGTAFNATTTVTVGGITINNETDYLNNYEMGAGVVGLFAAKYPGSLGNSLLISAADAATFTGWAYAGEFDSAPDTSPFVEEQGGSNDEMHIIIIDENGWWTGVQGGILERYSYVSKASDAKKLDGSTNYYKEVLNQNSKYVWWMDHPAGTNFGSPAFGINYTSLTPVGGQVANGGIYSSLSGGADDFTATNGELQNAFDLLSNDELYDINLIPCGPVNATVAKWVIENVAEKRKDCVAFVSPLDPVTGEIAKGPDAAEKIVNFRNDVSFNVSSSYAVMDSGYKYQYDRYNDVYRWVPLNGDIAGLCARTDTTNDPWWSPGGLNRGQVKNVVRLAFNPNKTDRDMLYKAGVNPVVSFPGQGVVLFGDKTLLAKPSAFDRINVRRLFIVLEKAIATAAKFMLFEFNDFYTRAQFRAMVEPYLRDVQGRRGIYDFRVKCDETNNTGEVIDRNEFVADLYIKPARSINFIYLNFVAVRTGVSFEEVGA